MEMQPHASESTVRAARRAESFRALMELLDSAGGSMRKAEVKARWLERLGVTPYERVLVRGTERWWLDLQFQFTAFSKAKWLTRVRGTWSITPQGVEALRTKSGPEVFEAAQEAYRGWSRTVRSDAAVEVLGWEPQVQIDEGMRRSFDWYVANRVAPAD